MTEESGLLQKREELKRQLTAGEYDTLVDIILDKTGYLIPLLASLPSAA